MESKKTDVGLTYGIISGIVSCVMTLVLYLAGAKWFLHPVAYIGYVIPIIFAVLAGLKDRKLHGGYLTFPQALKTVFLVFVIGSAIGTIFIYVLFNFIDVPFREALTQQAAEATEKFMRRMGAQDDAIDKAVGDMLSGNNYTIGKILLGFAIGCILWFIISLIIAAIVKRNPPVFQNPVKTQ